MSLITISLHDALNGSGGSSNGKAGQALAAALNAGLEAFECARSPYHEDFLKEKASRNCETNTSRTYLVVDESALGEYLSSETSASRIIAAYFTVGISSLLLEQGRISKKKQKKLKTHLFTRDDTIGCFVIGELCRASNRSKEEVPGEHILNECMVILKQAQNYIGGRIVLVDSRYKVLESLYEPFGFKELMQSGLKTADEEDLITSYMLL